jgi:group I intron endonuclease
MLISKSIRKYGVENFTVEVISEYDNDVLNEAEKLWIKELDTYENGYNLTLGGEGIPGFVFNEESRKKMSEKAKARGISSETRAKIAANTGKKWSAESLARRTGKKRGPYKKWSDEAKQARSEMMRLIWKQRKELTSSRGV